MRKYIILFFSVFPFLFACNSGGSSDDVMPKGQMIAVLTAVHLADGQMVNILQSPDTLYKYGTARYLAVFKQYHTDSAQFRRSYRYYSMQPDTFVAMYDKVLKKLQLKTDSLNKVLIKQNADRAKRIGKPATLPGNYGNGAGVAPQISVPSRPGPMGLRGNQTPAMRRLMFKKDSIMKAQLKKNHVISPK